eukprot:6897587-Pyramimonas_sp.AAC.2
MEMMGLPRPGGVTIALDRETDLKPVRKWVNLALHHATFARPAWIICAETCPYIFGSKADYTKT